jgi:glycerol-3-phosphate dehydrogenase (NAD(P)+)
MDFAVIGAGAWGTAFAYHLARRGQPVTLIARRAEHAAALNAARENRDYLPGVALPENVIVTGDLKAALAETDVAFLAVPSQSMREWAKKIAAVSDSAPRLKLVVSLSKGLEMATLLRLSEVLAQVLPHHKIGALTGPTNAREVADGQPAAMVLATAAPEENLITEVQAAISGPTLRVYTSSDLCGAEYGGCLKNIYAIAAGCGDGLKLGDNIKAAMLTRALTEMVRVGVALGARAETFYGLSGVGDLVATCYGGWSRNREFGQRIGEGKTVADLLAHRKTVVEGYKTTEAFANLCVARGVDAPILREVHAILCADKKPAEALATLMARKLKPEVASAK